ncbi:MAG: DUF2442 domain-containing protein [Synergistaceae bacterium]|nr:DUF2442 domain-containing protein [Synergistaceae bacterium]
MYERDGIVHAGEPPQLPSVCGVRPLDDHKLWVRFTTGEAKVFDVRPLLRLPVFAPLTDEAAFRDVYIDYGTTVWNGGEIDIDPEVLYERGVPVTP